MGDSVFNLDGGAIGVAASLARKPEAPFKAADGQWWIALPQPAHQEHSEGGYELKSLGFPPEGKPLPNHIIAAVKVDDRQSFTDYVKSYGDDATKLFAYRASQTLKAVIDYHEDGVGPARGDHTVFWALKDSEQLQRWTGITGKPLSQEDLANFIEENVQDVMSTGIGQPVTADGPVMTASGADVLQAVLNIESKSTAVFASAIRLDNNTVQLKMTDERSGASDVSFPSVFYIGIPLFLGEQVGDMLKVTLRHKIKEGKITFNMALPGLSLQKKQAFDVAMKETAEAVGRPLYFAVA